MAEHGSTGDVLTRMCGQASQTGSVTLDSLKGTGLDVSHWVLCAPIIRLEGGCGEEGIYWSTTPLRASSEEPAPLSLSLSLSDALL